MLSSPARAARIYVSLAYFLSTYAALLDVAFPDHSHSLVACAYSRDERQGKRSKEKEQLLSLSHCYVVRLPTSRAHRAVTVISVEVSVLGRQGERRTNHRVVAVGWAGTRQLSILVQFVAVRCVSAVQCSSAAYCAWATQLRYLSLSPQLRISFSHRYHISCRLLRLTECQILWGCVKRTTVPSCFPAG